MSNLNCQDYLIITGGYQINNHLPNKKLLQLNCNDFYEGLPEKIHNTYTFIYQNDYFNNYKYICKLDDDMVIKHHKIPSLLPRSHTKEFQPEDNIHHDVGNIICGPSNEP